MKLRPDPTEAWDFLRQSNPGGPHHLVAINEGGTVIAKTFNPEEQDRALHWIEERQKTKFNIYYHVNRLRDGVKDAKGKKNDVKTAIHLHVDVDDPEALERLRSFTPAPTYIVASGGGYNAGWTLEDPCEDLQRVEQANKALAQSLGADNCHNVDRVLRLPGTVNFPNAKKRASGRTEVLAHLVGEATDWSRRCSIESFAQTVVSSVHTRLTADVVPVGVDKLPASVSTKTRELITKGDDLENPIGTENARYPSRSEVVWRVVCDLARAECAGELIAGVLINPELGISRSIREKKDPLAYARRQAEAALETVNTSWPDATRDGRPKGTFRNALIAITRMGLHCEYDEFHRRKTIGGHFLQAFQGELSDDGCALLRQEIIRELGFDTFKENTREAANTLCLANTFNPVKDYLAALEWDRVQRLNTWLARYLGAADTELNAAIGRIMLVAAARRVRQPGVKFDTIVVLEGEQGTGKSTALKILAGGDDNFSDQDVLTLSPKEQMEALEGVWIFELGELEGISRAETTKVKAFASRDTDRGRPAYGRFRETRPRQNIFVGTTNDTQYLRDRTGNRRFWPVATTTIDLEGLRRDRDQLWAEAAFLEGEAESITLPRDLWEKAKAEQDERLEDDPWAEALAAVTGDVSGDEERVASNQLLFSALGIEPERQQQHHLKRLGHVMRQLGWEGPDKMKIKGKVVRGYRRPTKKTPE